MTSIHFLYYGDFIILNFSHLLGYSFLFLPDFLFKGIFIYAFSSSIDLAPLYFKGLSVLKARMNGKMLLLLKKQISLFLK